MKAIRALFARRGTPAWDALIRLTGVIGVLGIPLVLLWPEASGLTAFALASVWVHGPASPLLPATYEPILILFGGLYPPLLLAFIGTAANLLAEYLNYRVYGELLAQRQLDRVTSHPTLRRLVTLFNRRPFFTTWFVAWSPLPDWTVRILAPLARYPIRPWLLAMALGRLPRFWLLASLGRWVHVDARTLLWLALLPLGFVAYGLVRFALSRGAPRACQPAGVT